MGFECCMGLDLQREEFYSSINMLCHGRSCSMGLAGAWEKLSIHIISNVGTWDCSCLACWCTRAALLIHSPKISREAANQRALHAFPESPSRAVAFTGPASLGKQKWCQEWGWLWDLLCMMRLRPCFSRVPQVMISSPL